MINLDKWLSEVEARCEKATEGPWLFERQSFDGGDFAYERNDKNGLIAIYEHNYEKPMKAKFDSDFIAASRTDLPMALKIIRELREALKDIRSECTTINNSPDWCIDEVCAVFERVDRMVGGFP